MRVCTVVIVAGFAGGLEWLAKMVILTAQGGPDQQPRPARRRAAGCPHWGRGGHRAGRDRRHPELRNGPRLGRQPPRSPPVTLLTVSTRLPTSPPTTPGESSCGSWAGGGAGSGTSSGGFPGSSGASDGSADPESRESPEPPSRRVSLLPVSPRTGSVSPGRSTGASTPRAGGAGAGPAGAPARAPWMDRGGAATAPSRTASSGTAPPGTACSGTSWSTGGGG